MVLIYVYVLWQVSEESQNIPEDLLTLALVRTTTPDRP